MSIENFTKVEERAQELVNNLEQLRQQVGSYHDAKDELEKTNTNLLSFIEATQKLSEESHQVIQTINEIGSHKIFETLANIEKKQQHNLYIMIGVSALIIVLQVTFFLLKK